MEKIGCRLRNESRVHYTDTLIEYEDNYSVEPNVDRTSVD